jgi:translation elongation factor EF-Ts
MNTDEQKKIIIELRNKTNLPLIKCKAILLETNWNINKAIELLYNKTLKVGGNEYLL